MIWLYFDRLAEFCDRELQTDITEPNKFYGDSIIDDGGTYFDVNITHWEEPYTINFLKGYLSWDLTMPLAVEHSMEMALYPEESFAEILNDEYFGFSRNKNPLRAICEVLVQIKMEQKQ